MSAKPHFITLPGEIRNMIYQFLVPTELYYSQTWPTEIPPRPGVLLYPSEGPYDWEWAIGYWRPKKLVNGSWLRTCKLVYQEAGNLFFDRGTVILTDVGGLFEAGVWRNRIQHIRLDSFCHLNPQIKDLLDQIRGLLNQGDLKTVTLRITECHPGRPVYISQPFFFCNAAPETWFGNIFSGFKKGGAGWGHVCRRLELHTEEQVELGTVEGDNGSIKELHELFECEIWAGTGAKTLCWKNGQQIQPFFKETIVDEEGPGQTSVLEQIKSHLG